MTQEARYYYDCPIKAAFMSKYHGITLYAPETDEYEEEIYCESNIDVAFGHHGADKVFIHPESLPLLQPQVGDLVYASYYDKKTYVWRVTAESNGVYEVGGFARYGFGAAIDGKEIHEIIQRNGTPFIMPERGE